MSGGSVCGSPTARSSGRAATRVASRASGSGRGNRGRLVVDDDGILGPELRKSFRSSARTCCAVEPWASHPAPSAPLSVTASGAAAKATMSQTAMTCCVDAEPRRLRGARTEPWDQGAPRRGGSFGSACSWQSCQAPRQLGARDQPRARTATSSSGSEPFRRFLGGAGELRVVDQRPRIHDPNTGADLVWLEDHIARQHERNRRVDLERPVRKCRVARPGSSTARVRHSTWPATSRRRQSRSTRRIPGSQAPRRLFGVGK